MTTIPGEGRMFDTPAVYHIQIEGKLDPAWSSRLEGMTICVAQNEHGRQVTTLSGELIDQAALSGVLMHLYDMQMAVLSVSRL